MIDPTDPFSLGIGPVKAVVYVEGVNGRRVAFAGYVQSVSHVRAGGHDSTAVEWLRGSPVRFTAGTPDWSRVPDPPSELLDTPPAATEKAPR